MGKEEFKNFVKSKPELIDYIEDNTMTWQKFYEIYDMYGEDESVWERYSKKKTENNPKVPSFIDKIDIDTIRSHIDTAQKALGVISELTTKSNDSISNIIKPKTERPITKFFGD